jgi:hypothetical protein
MNSKTELIFNKWTRCIENMAKQKKIVDEKQNIVANATASYNNENMILKNLETEEFNLHNDLREAIKSEYSKEGN